jgi:N-methylhydantoinase A
VPFPDEPTGPALWKALTDGFERAHAQMYGYVASEEPIQAVTFRLEAIGAVPHAEIRAHPSVPLGTEPTPAGWREVWLAEARDFVTCPVFDRDRLGHGHAIAGPAVIEQMDATTLLLPGQRAKVDPYLNLLIEA